MMPVDTDRWIQETRREQIKDRRRKYWRAREAVKQRSADEEDWQTYHAHYHGAVASWVWSVHAAIEANAEESDSLSSQVWYEWLFGDYTGLEAVFEEVFVGEQDTLLPVEVLDEIGDALEKLLVPGLDLPEQPPVVDEPWHKSERRSIEELLDGHDLSDSDTGDFHE